MKDLKNDNLKNENAYQDNHKEKNETNRKENKMIKNFNVSEDIKGYGLVAGGTLLLLYSFGYFQVLNWAVMAGSIGLILWGALKSDLFSKIFSLIAGIFEFIKDKFSKNK